MGRNWQLSPTYKGLKIGTLFLKNKTNQNQNQNSLKLDDSYVPTVMTHSGARGTVDWCKDTDQQRSAEGKPMHISHSTKEFNEERRFLTG